MAESRKGQDCPYKPITCQEGFCQDCNIYTAEVSTSNENTQYLGCILDGIIIHQDKKVWCFDFDNTLTFTIGTNYKSAMPNHKAIKKVNDLFDKGHTIKIFTGRGSVSGIDWRELTLSQLDRWGIKYHTLVMGKPSFDIYIDDLAYNTKDWLNDNI